MLTIKYDPNVHYGYYSKNSYKKDPNNFTEKPFNRTSFVTKGAVFGGSIALFFSEAPRMIESLIKLIKKQPREALNTMIDKSSYAITKGKTRAIIPLAAATALGVINYFTSKDKALNTWDSLEKHDQYISNLKKDYVVLPWILEGVLIKK